MKGTVLITGASSGIGAALARIFDEQDYLTILCARHRQGLESVRETLDNPDVLILTADLSTTAGIQQLIGQVDEKGLNVDILVNNAGVMRWGNMQDQTQQEIDELIALNIQAVTTLTHHYLSGMIARGSGKILNVASVAAFQPVPAMGLYAATKAFVLSMSESLSEQLRGTGVSVTALCPGVTNTPSTRALAEELPTLIVSSADEVARSGFDALMNGEAICIPGAANKTAVAWAKIQPRSLVRRIGGIIARIRPDLADHRS